MLWTGATSFQVEGSTNPWTYSMRRSVAALRDIFRLSRMTTELTSLKNNKAKASKKSKLTAVNANACGRNLSHSERSMSCSMVGHTMITAQESRRRSKPIQRPFLDM
jgi:hypothetical protein